MKTLRFLLRFALGGLFMSTAHAHPAPGSAVMLDFRPDQVTAELRLPLTELELSFHRPMMQAPERVVASFGPQLAQYIEAHIHPVAPDGREWTVHVQPETMAVDFSQAPLDLDVKVALRPPPGAPLERFVLNYDVIAHEVVNHSSIVSIRGDWRHGVFSSGPEIAGVLHFLRKSIAIDRTGGSEWRGFRGVVALGLRHIAEGTDHLLFLFVLLLPAPLLIVAGRWNGVCGIRESIRRLARIVTAFTFGHSLTLAAGALGWLRFPSQPIEVLIAVSILVSALHAIRPIFPGKEAWIAAGFGLIHGLSFASVVADFDLGAWRTVQAIFGFNLGIELMQLAIVAVTMPWLLLLSRSKAYAPFRMLGASLAGVAALAWIVERVQERTNPLSALVNAAAEHAVWLIPAVAVTAVVATFVPRWSAKRRDQAVLMSERSTSATLQA